MITIPTLKQLYDSIIEDLENEFSITIPLFGKVYLRANALVQAGKLKMFYYALARVQKNCSPLTADPQSQGGTLEDWGSIKDKVPFQATQGQYTATVTGTMGATIPAGTTFISDDSSLSPNFIFILDNEYTLPASSGTITIRALTAGTDSRLAVGNTLTSSSPLTNVDSTITVASETTIPQAAETTEEYRARVLQSFTIEPQGGSVGDYRLWGLDAQGVRQIYPYPSASDGEVDLYVEATTADSTDGKGTPTSAILSDVADVVETDPDTTKTAAERARRPIGVFDVNIAAISLKEIDIDIADFTTVTAAQQTLIEAAITEWLYDTRPFIAGLDPQADRRDTFDANNVSYVILNLLPGSVFGAITINVDGSPVTSYTFDNGEIPYLDTITYS